MNWPWAYLFVTDNVAPARPFHLQYSPSTSLGPWEMGTDNCTSKSIENQVPDSRLDFFGYIFQRNSLYPSTQFTRWPVRGSRHGCATH